MRELPEIHQQGTISIENIPPSLDLQGRCPVYARGDFGIQIARDGRVWVCIDGIAFLRFSPHPNGRMRKEVKMSPGDRIVVNLSTGRVSALFVKRNSDGTLLVWPDKQAPIIVKEESICG